MLSRTHRTKSQCVKRKGMEMAVVMGNWEHASAFSTSRPFRPWSAFFSNLSITSHPLWQLVLIIRLRGGGGQMDYLPLQTQDPNFYWEPLHYCCQQFVGDNWGWGRREVVCILQGGFHGCIWPNEVGLSAIVEVGHKRENICLQGPPIPCLTSLPTPPFCS